MMPGGSNPYAPYCRNFLVKNPRLLPVTCGEVTIPLGVRLLVRIQVAARGCYEAGAVVLLHFALAFRRDREPIDAKRRTTARGIAVGLSLHSPLPRPPDLLFATTVLNGNVSARHPNRFWISW